MDIWHVENREWTKLRLWRMDNSDFRVIEAGTYEPLLTNATYTLVDKKFSLVFESLYGQVLLTHARIHDYLNKGENDNYIELRVLNKISPDTVTSFDSSGRKVWVFRGELLVTGELKNELIKVNDETFVFSLGFSKFGG